MSSPNSTFYEINPDELHHLHLNNNELTAIELTANNKFLIAYVKECGYFTFKVRRVQSYGANHAEK